MGVHQLSIEAYPDISDTQVVVITLYPGHAAEEIEQQVSVPIERALNSVPSVIARRSRTIFGLSVVELTFEYGTNDYFARQVVLEKLRDATLPDGVTPTLGPMSTPIGELYKYTLEGDRLRFAAAARDRGLGDRAAAAAGAGRHRHHAVRRRHQAVPDRGRSGCADEIQPVDPRHRPGGRRQQPERRRRAARQPAAGAGRPRRRPHPVGRATSRTSWSPPRTACRCSCAIVGRVQIGSAPRTGIFAIGDKTDRVEGIVLMRRGENPSEVLEGIHEAVDELNHAGLPAGVKMVPIYDRTDLVNNTLHTVTHTLLEGLVIVLVVLFLFLGSVRAALLTAITIPLSLLFAFICMHFTGIPANLLSLGALDFGIIVDGTLIMVEHIVHALEVAPIGPRDSDSVLDTIRDAALEVERPIFFSLLIIVAAYIPLFTLERVERRLFTPMAFTVCYALFGSMLIALTLIPVLATYLFRNAPNSVGQPGADVAVGALRAGAAGDHRLSRRVLAGAGARGRRRVRACPLARHRVPAAARRRRGLDSRQFSGRHLAHQVGRAGQRDPPARQAVAGGARGRVADRPQRRWHGSVRAESERAVRRADAVRHVAARQGQGRLWSRSCRSA